MLYWKKRKSQSLENESKKRCKIEIGQLDESKFSSIPAIYSAAFEDEPWEDDWHSLPQFDRHSAWVTEQGGKVIGFIISFLKDKAPYISVLAVLPECRRLGAAAKLVDRAASHWKAKNYKNIYAHLYNERIKFLPFYLNNSFIIEQHRKEYVVLKREL